jgi:site-specific DNA-methyltransferase (adenine-specific)
MRLYYEDNLVKIYQGDCRDINTDIGLFTGIVTDPPYSIGFMGQKWDSTGIAFNTDTWSKLKDVCQSGAFLLSFGGTRTFHRLAVAIEDAGWSLRDTMGWIYGSGFPKSLDISKSIDKKFGAEREIIGTYHIPNDSDAGNAGKSYNDKPIHGNIFGDKDTRMVSITTPSTMYAKEFEGYGTALKPAWEPILVCMKPVDGTFVNNALEHGVAGINVDECRVSMTDEDIEYYDKKSSRENHGVNFDVAESQHKGTATKPHIKGRFPANIIHDGSDEVIEMFPQTKSTMTIRKNKGISQKGTFAFGDRGKECDAGYIDEGSASRFFYCAKASKSERDNGCESMQIKRPDDRTSTGMGSFEQKGVLPGRNFHPTVKPLSLMRYLVKLIAPPKNALILDPFMGSGSTLVACKQLGIKCVGVELSEEYCEIAANRCKAVNQICMDFDDE